MSTRLDHASDMLSQSSPRDFAIELLAPLRLHQHLWLPSSQSHPKLRVTFATSSNFDQELPAILFIGPMFGNRYMAAMLNRLALDSGVRLICVDRPGFGGSTQVPLEKRMETWLETVPILLERLHIKNVSLVTHSAGTTFTLNTLASLRHVLEPEAPYVAFLAPWVSPEHSKMALAGAASKLPSGVISGWSGLNNFIAQNIVPAMSWSGGGLASFADLFHTQSDTTESGDTSYRDKYGVDDDTGKEIEKLIMKYGFAEGNSGGNDEARLCLGHADWGACQDYMTCMKTLADVEARRLHEDSAGQKLTVRLHFAASDVLIGEGGKKYFERCWQQEGMSESVEVVSKQWEGTNHDSVLIDLQNRAMRSVFEDVKRLNL